VDHAFHEGPPISRPWWVWASSAAIVVPTVATALGSVGVAIYVTAGVMRPENAGVLFGAALFPAPLLLVLLMEQWAVGKRVALAAILLAALFLMPAMWLGYATAHGALQLWRFGAGGEETLVRSWPDALAATAVTGFFLTLGIARLAWWRKILAASVKEMAEQPEA